MSDEAWDKAEQQVDALDWPSKDADMGAARHEYKTIRVLQYEPPRGHGKTLAIACEGGLEADGWQVMSASAVESNQHWNTTSFAIVARRPMATVTPPQPAPAPNGPAPGLPPSGATEGPQIAPEAA